MANLLPHGGSITRPLGLLVVYCGAAFAAEQPPSSLPQPAVLSAKQALRLAVRREMPAYPPVAKVNYIEGKVHVEVVVTSEGRVREAHVKEGHPLLAAATLEAVRNWSFRPARSRPGPAEFVTSMNMSFTLRARRKLRVFPSKATEDLDRQVRPPAVLEHPDPGASTCSVRLRILLSDAGRLLDSQLLSGRAAHFALARKTLENWTFQPARWGALPVPWYLEIEVPVAEWPTAQNRPGPCEG